MGHTADTPVCGSFALRCFALLCTYSLKDSFEPQSNSSTVIFLVAFLVARLLRRAL
jgi:hypothetical protein